MLIDAISCIYYVVMVIADDTAYFGILLMFATESVSSSEVSSTGSHAGQACAQLQ